MPEFRRPATAVVTLVAVLAAAGLAIVALHPGRIHSPADGPAAEAGLPGPATKVLPNGRRLTPRGELVSLGNFPTGAAATADGRYLWTVSAGFGDNDVRIVDTAAHKVCQTLVLPGASGGVALDSTHHLAYVSGIPNSRWQPSKNSLPGARGNAVLVYRWTQTCGQATLSRVISVPPPADAPIVRTFPPVQQRSNTQGAGPRSSWPQKSPCPPTGAGCSSRSTSPTGRPSSI